MKRYIDAAVIESRLQYVIDQTRKNENGQHIIVAEKMLDEIKTQPTAYDVMAVVSEMNDVLCNAINQDVADQVIEIVKRGGIE